MAHASRPRRAQPQHAVAGHAQQEDRQPAGRPAPAISSRRRGQKNSGCTCGPIHCQPSSVITTPDGQRRPERQRLVAADEHWMTPKNSAGKHPDEEGHHHRLPAEEGPGHHHQVGVAQAQRLDAAARSPNRKRTRPQHDVPASTPARPVARPSCQAPRRQPVRQRPPHRPGIERRPRPRAAASAGRHAAAPATAPPAGRVRPRPRPQHRPDQARPPCPVTVSDSGISRWSRSQKEATIRKQTAPRGSRRSAIPRQWPGPNRPHCAAERQHRASRGRSGHTSR